MDGLGLHDTYSEAATRRWTLPRLAGLAALFLLGCGTVLLAEFLQRLESQGFELIARISPLKLFCVIAVGVVLVWLLIRYSEVALALFFLVGLVKGDPRLASPVDLTLLVGAVVQLGLFYRLFIKRQVLRLPQEYLFYVPILAMMILSLLYAPDLSGGLDKLLRFVCLTSIGIIAPFTLFDNFDRMRRFFVTLALGGLGVAINSFAMLGGEDRMVSPSGLNTELGAASAVALIIIWGMIFPRLSLGKRMLFYPVLGVLGVALVGSGGRFANVSAVLCILIGAILCRKLLLDVLIAGALGLLALPFVQIPAASFEYLASLIHPSQAMGTRDDLIRLGAQMFSQHPLLGVGVSGFRYLSPNPLTYNYPHNLFLEIGSEMGILPAFAFLGLALCAFLEIIRQLRDPLSRQNSLVPTVFLLLIYVFLDAMVSGDINDLRFMWFVFGLPFVMRGLASTSGTLARALRKVPRVLDMSIAGAAPLSSNSQGMPSSAGL
ncbi:MAG TPA: O-antigen ligase family protein [Candidatus Sulfotelmatobacter sp.]|nr:O-antigen ligase family protein [Candidatus Sulfotelmatobacter sp.]